VISTPFCARAFLFLIPMCAVRVRVCACACVCVSFSPYKHLFTYILIICVFFSLYTHVYIYIDELMLLLKKTGKKNDERGDASKWRLCY